MDGDGFGDPASSSTCSRNAWTDVLDDTDCDDTDSSEYPGVMWYSDADGDSYGNPLSSSACTRGASTDNADNTDCDDVDAQENPTYHIPMLMEMVLGIQILRQPAPELLRVMYWTIPIVMTQIQMNNQVQSGIQIVMVMALVALYLLVHVVVVLQVMCWTIPIVMIAIAISIQVYRSMFWRRQRL